MSLRYRFCKKTTWPVYMLWLIVDRCRLSEALRAEDSVVHGNAQHHPGKHCLSSDVNDHRDVRICVRKYYRFRHIASVIRGTETVQVTPLRRTLASSP